MIVAVDLEQLAELACLEAESHEPRTPGRRAAAHLLTSLTEPRAKTITGARNAIASFGDERTQADALALMHQLAAATTEQETPA